MSRVTNTLFDVKRSEISFMSKENMFQNAAFGNSIYSSQRHISGLENLGMIMVKIIKQFS